MRLCGSILRVFKHLSTSGHSPGGHGTARPIRPAHGSQPGPMLGARHASLIAARRRLAESSERIVRQPATLYITAQARRSSLYRGPDRRIYDPAWDLHFNV